MLDGYDYLDFLPPGGFAWEFLRRNPQYVEQYGVLEQTGTTDAQVERMGREWGCCFAVDPKLRADQCSAIWPPQLDPSTLILVPAPEGLNARAIHSIAAEFKGRWSEGDYWVVADGRMRMTLVFGHGASPSTPVAALVPFDSHLEDRLEAVAQLRSLVEGDSPSHRYERMGYFARKYFGLKLRAVDARLNGLSYRITAQLLFGSDAVSRGADLRTKGVLSRTRYLVKEGHKLMSGGYRRLLTLRYPTRRRARRRRARRR